MPPVKWKAFQLIAGIAQPAPPAPPVVTPIATTKRAKPRTITACTRESHAAPLRDDVVQTPKGHRKHTLVRTSPGGTTRTAHYVSPLKGDATIDNPTIIVESEQELECEQCIRRSDALNKVPCQKSDAQRSSLARQRRKAGVPAAPRAEHGDRHSWGEVKKRRLAAQGNRRSCDCGVCRVCEFEKGMMCWEPLECI